MKELSEWQAERVRDALRAYHRYERGIDGEYFTWKDVREAIAEYTDVEIGTSAKNGAERLRQFVEGIEDGKGTGKRKFPLPQPAAIEAIVAFVTDEELNLLTKEELKEYAPQYQTHLRLLEFLDDGSETGRMIPPENIQGVYRVSGLRNSLHFVRELALQRSNNHGLIQVVETEDRYVEGPDFSNFDQWDMRQRRKAHKSRERHGGWAIFTPEDNLFFFLKKEENAKNRYYFTMAADVGLWSDSPHNQLVVLQHDFPFELEQGYGENPYLEKHILHEMKKNMLFLKKVE